MTKDITTRLIMLTKKIEDLLLKWLEIVKVIKEEQEICDICELQGQVIRHCPSPLTWMNSLLPLTQFLNRWIIHICQHTTPVSRITKSSVEEKYLTAIYTAYKTSCWPSIWTWHPTSNNINFDVSNTIEA